MPTMEHIRDRTNLPDLILDLAVYDRLYDLARSMLRGSPVLAERLLEEIERAEVLPSSAMPKNVVNIGSRVVFRDESDARLQKVTLALPADADISYGRISVLTPIGIALIGLAEGDSITWQTRSGENRVLTVTQVENGPS